TMAAVVSMLNTIFVAVPAFKRVDPAITSGPTAGAIVRSTKVCSSVRGSHVTNMIFDPARPAPVSAPRTNCVLPLPDTLLPPPRRLACRAVACGGPRAVHRPLPSPAVPPAPLARLRARAAPARHDRLHELGTGAEGRRHFRRLEHAEPPARAGTDEDDPA